MRARVDKAGETISFSGQTIVDGIPVPVRLTVNTVRLIHELGARAARSKGRKAAALRGAVVITADPAGADTVRIQMTDARRLWKAELAANRTADEGVAI